MCQNLDSTAAQVFNAWLSLSLSVESSGSNWFSEGTMTMTSNVGLQLGGLKGNYQHFALIISFFCGIYITNSSSDSSKEWTTLSVADYPWPEFAAEHWSIFIVRWITNFYLSPGPFWLLLKMFLPFAKRKSPGKTQQVIANSMAMDTCKNPLHWCCNGAMALLGTTSTSCYLRCCLLCVAVGKYSWALYARWYRFTAWGSAGLALNRLGYSGGWNLMLQILTILGGSMINPIKLMCPCCWALSPELAQLFLW